MFTAPAGSLFRRSVEAQPPDIFAPTEPGISGLSRCYKYFASPRRGAPDPVNDDLIRASSRPFRSKSFLILFKKILSP